MNLKLKDFKHGHLQLLNHEYCPECGNNELITDADNGEIVCPQCGLILQDNMINEKPEWRIFSLEDKQRRERVGLPITPTIHDMGLPTTFNITKDKYGKILPKNTRATMMRLRRWQNLLNMKNSHERNLTRAMDELKLISDKLKLHKHIQREAALIYRKALKMGMVRGRSIKDMIAASTHLACRINHMPRKLSETVTASGGSRNRIAKYYRKIIIKLRMKLPNDGPAKYVAKIANMLHIDQKTQNRAMELLRKAKGNPILGKKPSGIAAAILYIACTENSDHKKRSQTDLAQAADVTDVTIRNRIKTLKKALSEIL